MSLVDPSRRLWRWSHVLTRVTSGLWILVAVSAAVYGWAEAQVVGGAVWQRFAGADWLVGVESVPSWVVGLASKALTLSVVGAILGFFLTIYTATVRDTGAGWSVCHFLGWWPLGAGIGGLVSSLTAPVSAAPWLPLGAVVFGGLCLLLRPAVERRIRIIAQRREQVVRSGITTVGVATKVDVVIWFGVHYWKVTVKYTDQDGRDRWTRGLVRLRDAQPEVGKRYRVSHDPEHPGRRSSIVVHLRRPVGIADKNP